DPGVHDVLDEGRRRGRGGALIRGLAGHQELLHYLFPHDRAAFRRWQGRRSLRGRRRARPGRVPGRRRGTAVARRLVGGWVAERPPRRGGENGRDGSPWHWGHSAVTSQVGTATH